MPSIGLHALLALLTCVVAGALPQAGVLSLSNALIDAQFDPTSGNLIYLSDVNSSEVVVGSDLSINSGDVNIWSLNLVGPSGELVVTSRGTLSTKTSVSDAAETLSMVWNGVKVSSSGSVDAIFIGELEVAMVVTLGKHSSVMEWALSVCVTHYAKPASAIGLWEASIQAPAGISDTKDGELFYPTGFGVTYSNPETSTGGIISNTYPSGSASIQFMAAGRTGIASALYMAALDKVGEAKNLDYASSLSSPDSGSFLRFKIFPENAGVPMTVGQRWFSSFPVAVGVATGVDAAMGRPLWYEAAMLYRNWALPNAHWTQRGPLSARLDEFPTWYTENSIWLNTHWQCHDIFNETGGDPAFVLSYVKQIATRLEEPSLNLHWYEWQQGPDPAPESRYKFDTHYPDYFPARTDFREAVAALKLVNVSTFPYINGRISDIQSNSFVEDNGKQYCTKKTPSRLVDPTDPHPLVSYIETYGSGSSFCVTNPFTPYWQDKTADIIESLVFDYGVSGVYIDQIASAVPKLCWDAAHAHSLGNGEYWTKGYEEMMDTVADRIKDTRARPMVTEDNAEPYLHMLQGFLTLNAFKHSLAQGTGSNMLTSSHLAPAFPMIYGGYYVGFGAIWSREDFYDHDWWCARVAAMLVSGSQIGWFSLAGVDKDTEDSCGPMGVGDLLLSSDYDDLVSFLRLTGRSRAAVVPYFLHGHQVRPVVLSPEPEAFLATPNGNTFDYSSVASGVWQEPTENRVLIILATSTSAEYQGKLNVQFSNWDLGEYSTLDVWSVDSSGLRTKLGELRGPQAEWEIIVPGRSIVMLELLPLVH